MECPLFYLLFPLKLHLSSKQYKFTFRVFDYVCYCQSYDYLFNESREKYYPFLSLGGAIKICDELLLSCSSHFVFTTFTTNQNHQLYIDVFFLLFCLAFLLFIPVRKLFDKCSLKLIILTYTTIQASRLQMYIVSPI